MQRTPSFLGQLFPALEEVAQESGDSAEKGGCQNNDGVRNPIQKYKLANSKTSRNT